MEYNFCLILHAAYLYEQTYEKEITSVKQRHLKKFDNLFNKTHDCNELNSKPSVDKSRWVLNL